MQQYNWMPVRKKNIKRPKNRPHRLPTDFKPKKIMKVKKLPLILKNDGTNISNGNKG